MPLNGERWVSANRLFERAGGKHTDRPAQVPPLIPVFMFGGREFSGDWVTINWQSGERTRATPTTQLPPSTNPDHSVK